MRFVRANNNGHYDSQSKTVSWALAELPVNETGNVLLTAMPEEIGEQKLTYRGTAEGALSVEEQKEIFVDGYRRHPLRGRRRGGPGRGRWRNALRNPRCQSGFKGKQQYPPGSHAAAVHATARREGPGDIRSNVVGNRITFEPLRRLSPKVDTTYQIRVKCAEAGDQRISVQLQTDDMQSPVTKEESTRVFSRSIRPSKTMHEYNDMPLGRSLSPD